MKSQNRVMVDGFTSSANNFPYPSKSKRKKHPPRLHRQKVTHVGPEVFTNVHNGYALDGTVAG